MVGISAKRNTQQRLNLNFQAREHKVKCYDYVFPKQFTVTQHPPTDTSHAKKKSTASFRLKLGLSSVQTPSNSCVLAKNYRGERNSLHLIRDYSCSLHQSILQVTSQPIMVDYGAIEQRVTVGKAKGSRDSLEIHIVQDMAARDLKRLTWSGLSRYVAETWADSRL
jgi:hypothetical protein